jgi:glycosyltransferase involved in cell wall biosynthesis
VIEAARSSLAGVVHVTGWAYTRADRIEAVVVLIDGEPRALAHLGEPRPDVAVAFDHAPGSASAGWSGTVELPDHAGAQIAVSGLALLQSGLVERLGPVELTVMVAEDVGRVGHIERPEPGQEVLADALTIEGWALPSERLARIEVRVDGQRAGLARPLAVPRPDLALSPLPAAPLAGFVHVVDLSDHEPGTTVTIDADVADSAGKRTRIGPVTIKVDAQPNPRDSVGPGAALREKVSDACRRPPAVSYPPVRLLVVTHQLDLGGGQLYLFELLRRLLVELDISCLVVTGRDGPLHEQLEELGAVVHVAGEYPVDSAERYESMLLDLARLAREHGCNVAIANTMGAAIGADLAHRLGIPALWAIHESYTLNEFWLAAYGAEGTHAYVRQQATSALGNSAAVLFESRATRELYARHGDPHRFVNLPYGIDLDEIDAYRAKYHPRDTRRAAGISETATVLLCMGTYEPRKAQAALTISFAELVREFPDATLVLVGDNATPYAEALHEVVERLKLGDRIHLVPIVSDIYAWYSIADALVSASDVESLPRSVLEAMAFAVPVVAASVFGLAELIEDGISGMLFPARDLDQLVAALRRLLSMPSAKRRAIGTAGAELVRTRYDAAGYAGVYRQLLRGLIEHPDALPAELLSP